MAASHVAPGTNDAFSTLSLKTEKSFHEAPEHSVRTFVPDHEESEDKKEVILENLEDSWETDPENARNWSTSKKWVSMLMVRPAVHLCLLANHFLYDLRYRCIHLCHP